MCAHKFLFFLFNLFIFLNSQFKSYKIIITDMNIFMQRIKMIRTRTDLLEMAYSYYTITNKPIQPLFRLIHNI